MFASQARAARILPALFERKDSCYCFTNMDGLQRRSRKKLEILRSAFSTFRTHGYHGTTVNDIARALNMTTPNLYHYFHNKEEILYECHNYSLDLILSLLVKMRSKKNLLPSEQLHFLIVSFVHTIVDPMVGAMVGLDIHALSPERARKIIAKRDKFERAVRKIVKDGAVAGIFRPCDPKLVTFEILGALNWIPRWYDADGPAQPHEIAQVFSDNLLGGLLNPATSSTQATRRLSRLGTDCPKCLLVALARCA